ncbi:11909_t:CDS:1, partial [Gigaspora margarita]
IRQQGNETVAQNNECMYETSNSTQQLEKRKRVPDSKKGKIFREFK